MRAAEHNAKTPSRRTGLFATLRGFLHGQGSGAPSARPATTSAEEAHLLASVCLRRPTVIAPRLSLALIFALAALLTAPTPSFSAFTRPFIRQITGTPSGPFAGPGSVAVDGADNLWVSELGTEPPFKLDGFEYPFDEFLTTLNIEAVSDPESLAIERSTGHLYVARFHNNEGTVEVFDSKGVLLNNRFGGKTFEGEVQVAIDNSTEPSAGSVYVASEGERVIHKFNASGAEVSFTGSAPYISGNRITGTPSESFGGADRPEALAVDSHGDIYAVDQGAHSQNQAGVEEFSPSGVFLRAFVGKETPGLGEEHTPFGGFGGPPTGVAVDPLNGHVLVSVHGNTSLSANEGAVDEFDSTGHFLSQITATSQGHRLHSAFAMTADSHGDLYVVDSHSESTNEHAVDVYGPGHFLPSITLAEATERKPTSALLGGSVDPEGLPLSDCHFEYVTEAAFDATGFSDLSSGGKPPCLPVAASIPPDNSFHPVTAKITGLTSGTTYHYRLLATSEAALGGTAASAALAFTAPAAPLIASTTAANLSSTFADLRAQIDPLGADTSYHFEYLTAAAYQANGESWVGPDSPTSVPAVPADIGSGGPTGSVEASVLQHLGGLQPSTAYRFRVVATNEIGATAGPDATFATLSQVSPGLPDGRAYELVTPPNKGSAIDMFGASLVNKELENVKDSGYPSESGNQFLLSTLAGFGPFPASVAPAYVFSRTASGWTYASLASPSLGVQSLAVDVFDPSDFSRIGVDGDAGGSASSLAGGRLTSLIGPPGGPYATLHVDLPVHHGEDNNTEHTKIVGASHDVGDVILQSGSHTLAPGAESQDEGSRALYEWERVGVGGCTSFSPAFSESVEGCLQLVNVNSGGSLLNRCGAVLGQGTGFPGATRHAVSADGSRVLFTAPDPNLSGPGCWNGAEINAPQLYMRSGGTTIQVSAPQAGAPEAVAHHPAFYVGASEDGSKVFFLSESELTKDDEGIHDPELYEYDTEKPEGERLTRVSAGESGKADAHVWIVPAVSADGSAVYFTARGQLTADAPATSGVQVDLYRYDTNTATTTYVATVSKRDYPSAGEASWPRPAVEPEIVGLNARANWYTTPDGRYLLFASETGPTGYSTYAGFGTCYLPKRQDNLTAYCNEVYRYHYEPGSQSGGSIVCVSCNPTGAPPTSNALFAGLAFGSPAAGPPRPISDDGSYAFFQTADSLVPQDTNGAVDVYEWHEGKLSLISSGHDFAPSFFLGSSPDGSNVFFGTHARLVPQDTDSAGDVYDARICTESDPCVKPPAEETAQCEGDACQNPPPALIDATPGSLTFSGAGNVAGEAGTQVKHKKKTKPHPRKPKRRRHRARHASSHRRAGR